MACLNLTALIEETESPVGVQLSRVPLQWLFALLYKLHMVTLDQSIVSDSFHQRLQRQATLSSQSRLASLDELKTLLTDESASPSEHRQAAQKLLQHYEKVVLHLQRSVQLNEELQQQLRRPQGDTVDAQGSRDESKGAEYVRINSNYTMLTLLSLSQVMRPKLPRSRPVVVKKQGLCYNSCLSGCGRIPKSSGDNSPSEFSHSNKCSNNNNSNDKSKQSKSLKRRIKEKFSSKKHDN
ncbi:hypothetical protein Ciccas_006050 [Cichlidogyrus casuarinus]|uniref:Uncharacterized protein n=1 Tax=Cichlidogyrus casuarinus TaxID=1844966 RepID=A0ABD2Q780_9PLAT